MQYVLIRILGNELPPRDAEGNRIKVLKYILENEPHLESCRKMWIVNQIHDTRLRQDLIDLLRQYDQDYYELRFNLREYTTLKSRDDKIRCAININKARNKAIELCPWADFTFVFDGDCFFTKELWTETSSAIAGDQAMVNRKYYGVPGIRVVDELPANYRSLKQWEPSLVFRKDAELRFDERIPFSKCDKVELLQRLGYIREHGETVLRGDLCKNVGCLIHISFDCDDTVENDLKYRMKMRDESIDRLLGRIGKIIL